MGTWIPSDSASLLEFSTCFLEDGGRIDGVEEGERGMEGDRGTEGK